MMTERSRCREGGTD